MRKKIQTPKIIEIHVHRSKKNPRLGHAVSVLFPCSHRKYLGLTLYKGEVDSIIYRAQDIDIIRLENYSVMDKEICKLCPQDDFWLDDIESPALVDSLADVLDALDEE
jgi:hypothetical protein